jgi:hypothetical protein
LKGWEFKRLLHREPAFFGFVAVWRVLFPFSRFTLDVPGKQSKFNVHCKVLCEDDGGLDGVLGTFYRAVKCSDVGQTNECESEGLKRSHRSGSKVRGAKMIRYRRSPDHKLCLLAFGSSISKQDPPRSQRKL